MHSRNGAVCRRDETDIIRMYAVAAHISGLEVMHHAPK
eukprot:COSAG02_NODE_3759_length_6273_cov_2.503401_5_plen_38_part_00